MNFKSPEEINSLSSDEWKKRKIIAKNKFTYPNNILVSTYHYVPIIARLMSMFD
jgi:hypothetical protein